MRSIATIAVVLLAAAPLFSQQQHPPELVALAKEFREWRSARSSEVPHYVQRVEQQKRGLADFRKRLGAIDPKGWPVHAQVDYLVLQIEMNALDFDLNVIRQPSRNPNFYTTEAVSRVGRHIGGRYQMAPGVTVPYDADRAAAIIKGLEDTPAIVEQAPAALTEAVPEMADMAIETLDNVRENYAEFARVVRPHLPEPYRTQVGPAADKTGVALEKHREWIRANRAKMKAPFAIGRPAFEWYTQNVLVLPYTADQLLMQAEMERQRNWAFLQFERQKNRHLPGPATFKAPPSRAAKDNHEYSEWKDATDVLSRLWAEEHDLFTRPDYLGPMRDAEGGVWIEPFGMMAFPNKPMAQGSKTEFLVEPDHWFSHIYWEIGHRLDPGTNHPHSDYPGHTFERAVSQRTTCELRRGHNSRGDGWTYYMEEAQLQLDYPFVRGPRVREWMFGLAIMRAERVHIAVKFAEGSMNPEEVSQHMMDTVPWMEPHVANKHEVWRKFVRPSDVLDYQVTKFEIYKLLRDRMRQQGDQFGLRDFHDQLLATGQIAVALARWEMAGIDDDVKHLWKRTPIPRSGTTTSGQE
jgi:hypothetical protein